MPPSRNALRRACAAASPGCPVVAQAAGPIRPGRLELPVLQPVARRGPPRPLQRLRRRQRLRRIAERLHPPPERREHAQAPVLLVADLARRSQQIAGEAVRGDADLSQRGGDLIGHGPVRRLRDLVPVDRLGADLARERGDDRGRRSLAQHQRRAPLTQARLQGAQRLRQPPSRRAARAAECPALCRRARKRHATDACALAAACSAGWSERRRSSRYQTMGGHARIGSIEFLRPLPEGCAH